MANQQPLFRALADPTRRAVLRLLRKGSLPAGKIAERFEQTPASISHHLAILKQAELVRAERRGQQIVYSLNASVVEEIGLLVAELFGVAGTGEGGRKDET